MNKKHLIYIGAALVFALLYSCVKTTTEQSSSSFSGTYKTACYLSSAVYYIESLEIISSASGYTVNHTTTSYGADSTCTTKFSTTYGNGTFTSGGTTIATPSDATSFDGSFGYYTLTPNSSQAVTDLNTATYCGATWILDSTVSLLTKTCGAITYGSTVPRFQIYKLSNTTTLHFGDVSGSNDGSASNKRPNAYSANVFTKQ